MLKTENGSRSTSIGPWFWVQNGAIAVEFYRSAFGALETYRLETPDGLITRLSDDEAEFWISSGSSTEDLKMPLGGDTIFK